MTSLFQAIVPSFSGIIKKLGFGSTKKYDLPSKCETSGNSFLIYNYKNANSPLSDSNKGFKREFSLLPHANKIRDAMTEDEALEITEHIVDMARKKVFYYKRPNIPMNKKIQRPFVSFDELLDAGDALGACMTFLNSKNYNLPKTIQAVQDTMLQIIDECTTGIPIPLKILEKMVELSKEKHLKPNNNNKKMVSNKKIANNDDEDDNNKKNSKELSAFEQLINELDQTKYTEISKKTKSNYEACGLTKTTIDRVFLIFQLLETVNFKALKIRFGIQIPKEDPQKEMNEFAIRIKAIIDKVPSYSPIYNSFINEQLEDAKDGKFRTHSYKHFVKKFNLFIQRIMTRENEFLLKSKFTSNVNGWENVNEVEKVYNRLKYSDSTISTKFLEYLPEYNKAKFLKQWIEHLFQLEKLNERIERLDILNNKKIRLPNNKKKSKTTSDEVDDGNTKGIVIKLQKSKNTLLDRIQKLEENEEAIERAQNLFTLLTQLKETNKELDHLKLVTAKDEIFSIFKESFDENVKGLYTIDPQTSRIKVGNFQRLLDEKREELISSKKITNKKDDLVYRRGWLLNGSRVSYLQTDDLNELLTMQDCMYNLLKKLYFETDFFTTE